MWVVGKVFQHLCTALRKQKLWSCASFVWWHNSRWVRLIAVRPECIWSWTPLGRGPEGLFLPTLAHAKLSYMLSSSWLRPNKHDLMQEKRVYIHGLCTQQKSVHLGLNSGRARVQAFSSVLIQGKFEDMHFFHWLY